MSTEEIDFVVYWVDGSDAEWQKKLRTHRIAEGSDSNSSSRFRDLETLKYVFRGIDKNASWYRYVHFVTEGHLPQWLNHNNPRIKIHRHSDIYKNKADLPTFNSSSIELNFLGIPDLCEKFVLFNDDTIITRSAPSSRFFQDNMPVDFLVQNIVKGALVSKIFPHNTWVQNIANSVNLINREYGKHQSEKLFWNKYFSNAYLFRELLHNVIALPFSDYLFFEHYHHPQPHLKSMWEKGLSKYGSEIANTSANRFRARSDVTHYLFRYMNLVEGNFVPLKDRDFITLELSDMKATKSLGDILKSYRFVCLNDVPGLDDIDYTAIKEKVLYELDSLLPNKSSFET